MSKVNFGQIILFFIVIWWVQVFYMLLPPVITVDRVFAEWRFWANFIWMSFMTFFTEDDLQTDWRPVHAIATNYPVNDAPLEYVTYVPSNFTLEKAMVDTRNFDIPFIVKGFATDLLEKFEYDYIVENFGSHEYDFEISNVLKHNFTTGKKPKIKHTRMTFQDGMKQMKKTEDLYLRFSQTLHQQNPEFGDALSAAMARVGPGFAKHVGNVDTANRLCFIGMGEKSKTPQHAAVTDNWFLQVAGAKRWVIAPPEYTPYWKPVFTPTVALGSLLPLYDEKMNVPVLEITSEPGDLFFFPGWWWHEVNNEGSLNFGCGIRPRESVLRVFKSLAIPALSFPSGSMGIYLSIWPQTFNVLRKNLNFQFTTDWKKMFNPKSHQKWWARGKAGDGDEHEEL